MSYSRSGRALMVVVTLVFVAGMLGVFADPGQACGKCECAKYWSGCYDPCAGCCKAPVSCCKVSVCSGCVYEPWPQMCAPKSWCCSPYAWQCCAPSAKACCAPRGCCCAMGLTQVQIAVGTGQPETVRGLRCGTDVLVPVREVFSKLGASVAHRGWGRVEVTLNEKTVTLAQSCWPGAWGTSGVAGARMVCCKMYAPVSALAGQLGVTVEKDDSVIRLRASAY